jgi:hypothetical protein
MRFPTAALLALAVAAAACTTVPGPRLATAPDDSPEPWSPRVASYREATTYPDTLRIWRTPEDVTAWMGARFSYDASRAMLLSESARSRGAAPAIHRPADFFAAPSGMCLDLARFAVETLAAIDAQLLPAYLMIEFEPVTVAGETMRLHWLALFRRDGRYWFVGDSKRPGHVAGPYASVEAFVDEYSRYRQRKVVAFRETASFERRQRTPATRAERQPLT